MLEKAIEFVDNCFIQQNKRLNKEHFQRTVDYLLILKPDADEAMQIAAYSHDVSRAFQKVSGEETLASKKEYDLYLIEHQRNSADIIKLFLEKNNYDKKDIERIYNMVSHHEVGGDFESDLIKDADSLSYFEVNVLRHIETFTPKIGKDNMKMKIDFMYDRITNEKAKELAKPMYGNAMKILGTS